MSLCFGINIKRNQIICLFTEYDKLPYSIADDDIFFLIFFFITPLPGPAPVMIFSDTGH